MTDPMTLSNPARTPSTFRASDWTLPLGLVALGLIPALGGAVRLASFVPGGPVPEDGARFGAQPWVLAVHVVSALTYSLLGALQFSPGLRRRRLALHRAVGRWLVPAGLVAGLSGLATMLLYPASPTAGPPLHAMRITAGVAMIGFLALGVRSLARRDFRAHGAWMTRAYALGIAPGTQALALAPLLLVFGVDTELSFTTSMALGWLVNLSVAEWTLSRRAVALPAARSMRAVVYDRYGSPDVLRLGTVARPAPGPGQVLVRVEATSLNALDRRMVRADPFLVRLHNGLFRPRIRVLGADVAGRVEALGEGVREWHVGDRVFGECSNEGLGAFAEVVAIGARSIVAIPEGLDVIAAASLPLAAGTALQAVRERARVQPGQRVLVWGAGGAVGAYLVQLAKAYGANVTAVAGPGSVERLRSLGADRVVDRTHGARLETERFDSVFGVNGYRPLAAHLAQLVPGGVYVMVGGDTRQIFEALLLGALRARWAGRRLEVLTMDAKLLRTDLEELCARLASGALRPVVDRVVPLTEVAEALREVERGDVSGKIVLDASTLGGRGRE